MSRDVIALVPSEPGLYDVLDGMITAGPSLRVRAIENGPVIQLCDEEEVTLVSIELPVRVRLPGEVERLLGTPPGGVPDVPLWWVEARVPSTRDGGEERARRFAATLSSAWAASSGPHCRKKPMRARRAPAGRRTASRCTRYRASR